MGRGIVTDAAAERAASAVIAAGKAWEDLQRAVYTIQQSKLTPRAVTYLIADELDIDVQDVERVVNAIQRFPTRHLEAA